MTPSPSLPVRHVFERGHTGGCIDSWNIHCTKKEYGGLGNPNPPCICQQPYTATPTPGLEWVVGHMNHCIQCQPFCGGECTCPHSTQTWVSVPSGAVEPMLITKDATLQYWGHGTWLPVQGAPEHAHYREAWEEIGPVWTDARKDEGEIVAPRPGLIFLCERWEECPVCGSKADSEVCDVPRRWVLEWGSTWQGVPDWSDMAAVAKAMDDLGYAALLVFPSPESRDAGRLDEAGQVERRYLG